MSKSIRIAAVLGVLVGGIALAQVAEPDDPFEVPVARYGDWGEWDPDRELTFRFEDWWLGETVTGRFITLSIPIGYTYSISDTLGSPDRGSTGMVHVHQKLATDENGDSIFLPHATQEEEWRRRATIVPPNFSARLSSNTSKTGRLILSVMRRTKARNASFPGYEWGSFSKYREEDLYHVGEYCGFDMFESTASRLWHTGPDGVLDFDNPPPQDIEYSFDRARIFGWPDANGVTYSSGIICQTGTTCYVDARLRDWMGVRLRFRPELLCEMPKVIPTYLDWLESRVIEEETEILNPAFR